MQKLSVKGMALSLHRWVGLILAPLFLLIIISGGVLAFKPIVEDPMITGGPAIVKSEVLQSTLAKIDPADTIRQLNLSADGQVMTVISEADGPNGSFAVATGERVPGTGTAIDIFGIVKSFHKNLLIGAGSIVLYATFAMLAIVLIGPFLSWLRMSNTVLGWHITAGWLALPLFIMLPLTGILMTYHIDIGKPLILPQSGPRAAFVQSIDTVSQTEGFKSVISARRFKAGSVMLETVTDKGQATYIVGKGLAVQKFEGPGLFKSLHEGTWAGAWSGILNFLIAVAMSLLTVTGFISWFRRWRQSKRKVGSADADILVAYASQTGTAAQLAEATYKALEAGGAKAACMALSGVRIEHLGQYRHLLIIASTTGEGDLAEPGRAFMASLHGAELNISFSMLALGDKRYQHFCAGGEKLRSVLLGTGAQEFMEIVRADGAPQKAWHEWLDGIQKALSITVGEVEAPKADAPVEVTLIERNRLDNCEDHVTSETWQIVFELKSAVPFRPGDLLMLSPGKGETERCYSIGNSAHVTADRIILTVSRNVWTDEAGTKHFGKMSNLLCNALPIGTTLSGAVRYHPAFNPPDDVTTPVIMVATGCGIAPFTGFIEERQHSNQEKGPAWLLFGNRHREGDFFYRDTLASWEKSGALTRLSTAFSRDEGDGTYVTDRIVKNGAEIVDLIRNKGGILYVCGKTRLGNGVDAALVTALVTNDNIPQAQAEQTIQQWKAAGSLRYDLFD
ncbi:PepSY domain-containing protein [Microvirga sp. W0021]|uniref:NADPH--hemoprotein reductase n=1 Tax=Hohaiivirga grylli TaxID=3133970 RepID=A0ABV0BGK6_9HYPH